jgi:hypothetical protein
MINTEMPEFAHELTSRDLADFTQRVVGTKTDLESYAYALSLVWSLSDNKLKEKVITAIEEYNRITEDLKS